MTALVSTRGGAVSPPTHWVRGSRGSDQDGIDHSGPAAAAAVTAAVSTPPTQTALSGRVVCGAATWLRSRNGNRLNQQSLLSVSSALMFIG